MIIQKLEKAGLIHPPKFLSANCMYLTIMGSVAYGVSSDTSDMDLYGFALAPKELTFPHLAGEIPGFGRQHQRFEQWQEHHIKSPDSDQEYDFSVYSIVKYFDLCMSNNPNMIDSLFTARRHVIHSTHVAEMVRERRREFLHKGSWHKFKGYAYAQMGKIRSKTVKSSPKRAESIAKFGYDVKFAYHVVRLLSEVEQILIEGDLDLERNREQLKSIRRGEWSLEQIEDYFTTKEQSLEQVYAESKLPHSPDEERIKELLLNCLEAHYGNLDRVISRNDTSAQLLRDMQGLIDRYSTR
ncbi:MAG: nucleotidyltransferase [Oxalobacteraceae bacterium]|nr:MAG: nucleotidyltransferase [Oxalobacteraceae bacterium]